MLALGGHNPHQGPNPSSQGFPDTPPRPEVLLYFNQWSIGASRNREDKNRGGMRDVVADASSCLRRSWSLMEELCSGCYWYS